MKLKLVFVFVAFAVTICWGGPVFYQVSSCQTLPGTPAGMNCDAYPVLTSGAYSEVSDTFSLAPGFVVTAGFLATTSGPAPTSLVDYSNVIQILELLDTGTGTAAGFKLYTKGCNIGTGNTSCFPTLANFNSYPHALQTQGPVTAGFNVTTFMQSRHPDISYKIYDPVVGAGAVPEPATMAITGIGLLAAGLFHRRRVVKK